MSNVSLSDGSVLCHDYTAASVVDNIERLRDIQAAFKTYDEEQIQVTRAELNSRLQCLPKSAQPLTVAEFNSVLVTLTNTHAATESQTTTGGYSQYTFSVTPSKAIQVLDQQVIAVRAGRQLHSPEDSSTDVRLVSTLPEEIESELAVDVGRLDIALRRMLLDASDTVRISNPYFDPDQWIIDDLAALPSRGIKTRILTREVTGENPDERALEAVTAIVKSLSSDEIQNVKIRDFFETSRTGYQTGAVHAKIISVDNEQCYIGSANLTNLNLHGNFEFGVILEGDLVSDVSEVFDAVFERSESVPL